MNTATGFSYNALPLIKNPATHILASDVYPDGSSLVGWYDSGIFQITDSSPFALSEYNVPGANVGNHQRPMGRHTGMVSTLYMDGHVKAVPFDQLYGMPESQCPKTACNGLAISKASSPALWDIWGL